MKIGTRSILFGGHQFLIHPLFVALAWWKLYGFPWDPRLWVAFFVHDLGYWGLPNMDGPEGERHVEWGANVMGRLFGPEWKDFCLYHSRFYAKRDGQQFSRLCIADKLSFCLTPRWLYLLMTRASGEVYEYIELAKQHTEADEPKYASMNVRTGELNEWWHDVAEYLRRWVAEHKDGKEDTWTPTLERNDE